MAVAAGISLAEVLDIGVERTDIEQGFFKQFGFLGGQVAAGFYREHFEGFEYGGGRFEVDGFLAACRVGELAEE